MDEIEKLKRDSEGRRKIVTAIIFRMLSQTLELKDNI